MRPPEMPSPISQKRAYLFAACVFFVFMQAGLLASQFSHSSSPAPSPAAIPFTANSITASKYAIKEHPIPQLMQEAEMAYRRKLAKQSSSLKAAVKEYQRRYRRNPPKGFNEWWEFAQENNFKMIDEFDGMVDDLAPFWELSSEEFRRRSVQAGYLPSIELVRVRGGNATVVNVYDGRLEEGTNARALGFRRMIQKFVHALPDMDFAINTRSEGRVLVPWENRQFPNITVTDSSAGLDAMLGGPFLPDWQGQGSVWDAWRRTCPPESISRRLFSSLRSSMPAPAVRAEDDSTLLPGDDFTFARDTSANLDYCAKPYAHYIQGHFFSDWRTVPALYPILSPAKAVGFSDIRIPSHYYYSGTARYTYGWDPINLALNEVDKAELPWEEKSNKIFWRGASTGGGNHPPGFSHQYQRHRFLGLTSDLSEDSRSITFADPSSPVVQFVTAEVPISSLNEDIMDVAFVTSADSNAYIGGPEAMYRDYRYGDAASLSQHWAYKYLVDFDGMGYSGRFMAFMASDSAVIKSTVYKEYFSDWLQPWLHFIPLSSSYREIYNVYSYFSGPTKRAVDTANITVSESHLEFEEGDRNLRRIARAGKQWKKTMGRKVDMEVYIYRLCLEYARLWADDRIAMDFTL